MKVFYFCASCGYKTQIYLSLRSKPADILMYGITSVTEQPMHHSGEHLGDIITLVDLT